MIALNILDMIDIFYVPPFIPSNRLFRTAIDPVPLLIAYTFKEETSHSVSHCLQLQTGSNILFLDPAAQCTGWSCLCLYTSVPMRHPMIHCNLKTTSGAIMILFSTLPLHGKCVLACIHNFVALQLCVLYVEYTYCMKLTFVS